MPFNKYPGVDETDNFPPQIRAAFAKSKEFVDGLASPVAKALANDTTVKDAATAAVNKEITLKDLASMPIISDAKVIFSVVDEDGRRTWLEISSDGGPSEYTIQKLVPFLADPVSAAVGVAEQNTAITGLAFAIVDEDGRRTELEVGPDGRLSQRVIDSIGSRLTITPPADPTTIILPSSIPALVGTETRMNYKSIVGALDPSHSVLTSLLGNFGTHWAYTPATAATTSLQITVVDRVGKVVKTATVPFQSYVAPSGTGKRHLAIGDSITRAGDYVLRAVQNFSGAKTVGTRSYSEAGAKTEGRGGWSLNGYFDNIGHESWGDSPFLFPTNVSGAKFWGNTQFWKRVCYEDPNGYDYQGFQKMARGWSADASAPFLYGTDGYPLAPAEGDVVVDPTFAEADEFRQYTGGTWVAIARPTIEFSFAKYLERYSAAFPDGPPTSISIMLETNDFFNGVDDAKFDVWKNRMDQVISSVRAWSTTVPFVILCAPTGGSSDKWGGQTVSKFDFDRRMQDAAARIISTYDTAAHRTNRVYVASALGAVDPVHLSDHVHPSTTDGHTQLSRPLAGMLARLITEGVA